MRHDLSRWGVRGRGLGFVWVNAYGFNRLGVYPFLGLRDSGVQGSIFFVAVGKIFRIRRS